MSTNRPSALPRRNHNDHTNHPFGKVITKNYSISSEISAIDCDSITLKYLPQILTEKKGGSLDIRKYFLFLRIYGFGIPHVILSFLFGDLMGFNGISAYSFILRDKDLDRNIYIFKVGFLYFEPVNNSEEFFIVDLIIILRGT